MVNNARPQSAARVQPGDLLFFTALARAGSLSAAGRELGVSTPAVSKHLAQLEARVGVTLVNRTTRRMGLTPEGEVLAAHARQLLQGLDELDQALGGAHTAAKGLLRVNATLGFGRSHVAPLVSRFAKRHSLVAVQLQLSVNPPSISEDAYDVGIRFGPPPDSRLVARRLAANERVLCASPAYLARHGVPSSPQDLLRHACITIRQGDEAYGTWRLRRREKQASFQAVKVRGALSTNDGAIAVTWALEGHGILLRAQWDVDRHLSSGRLVRVLAGYETPDADLYAVYPKQHRSSQRVRVFVDFMAHAFAQPSRGS